MYMEDIHCGNAYCEVDFLLIGDYIHVVTYLVSTRLKRTKTISCFPSPFFS